MYKVQCLLMCCNVLVVLDALRGAPPLTPSEWPRPSYFTSFEHEIPNPRNQKWVVREVKPY